MPDVEIKDGKRKTALKTCFDLGLIGCEYLDKEGLNLGLYFIFKRSHLIDKGNQVVENGLMGVDWG